MKHIFKFGLCALTLMLASLQANADVLIDYNFDNSGTDIGPAVQELSNGNGTGFSANTTTGVISTGNGGSNGNNNNNTTGFNSSGTVDVSTALGFSVTYEISGANANLNPSTLQSNGLFFGVVAGATATANDGTALYNNDPDAFGYVAGSGVQGDHSWFEGNGTTDIHAPLTSSQPANDSFEDGFTITITLLNDDSWTISSTGLINDFVDTGSLGGTDASTSPTSSLTYSDFNDLGIYTSLQGRNNGSDITLNRITLETIVAVPEPSSAALLGLGGLGFLLRRRK